MSVTKSHPNVTTRIQPFRFGVEHKLTLVKKELRSIVVAQPNIIYEKKITIGRKTNDYLQIHSKFQG